jgi:hypothetical protein
MNTNARLTTRTVAAATCLAALFAGATACGTEDGTASAKTGSRPASVSSVDLISSAKTNQAVYLQRLRAQAEAARQLRAEAADAARWAQGQPGDSTGSHGYGDDHRHQQAQVRSHRASSAQHAPGFDKALPGNW